MTAAVITVLRPWLAVAWVAAALFQPAVAHAADAVQAFERTTLKRIEQEQGRHPFWLVLWDLECTYCAQSMKNLAAAQQRDPSLRIVTVATDAIGEHARLAARLRDTGLHGAAYAFSDDNPEALRYAIDPKWRGEKPRTYFYDGQGGRKSFSGVVSAERIGAP